MRPFLFRGYKPRIYRDLMVGKWLWCCDGKGLASYADSVSGAYELWHRDTYWHYHCGMEA